MVVPSMCQGDLLSAAIHCHAETGFAASLCIDEFPRPNSLRISPDLDSVGVVLFSRGFLARNYHFLQCPTGPF